MQPDQAHIHKQGSGSMSTYIEMQPIGTYVSRLAGAATMQSHGDLFGAAKPYHKDTDLQA